MRNKLLASFLLAFLVLTGCGTSGSEEIEVETPPEEIIEEVDELESVQESSESEVTEPLQTSTKPTNANFDHISSSLTRYLIWWGEEMAMVENCPGGYEEGYGEGSDIYFCADPDKRWLEFESLDGTVVKAPDEAGEYFLWDYRNIGGSSFQWTMSEDEKYWIYLDNWSDDEAQVVSYNVNTATEETLLSFLAVDYNASCSGIRFFGWNPSQTKLGVVVSNEERDAEYPTNTKVFILTIEDGKLSSKNKYDLPVVADCSPNNGPFFAIDWLDDDTIGYYDPSDNPYGDYTKDDYNPEYLEAFFWSEDPWGSAYASYYEVK